MGIHILVQLNVGRDLLGRPTLLQPELTGHPMRQMNLDGVEAYQRALNSPHVLISRLHIGFRGITSTCSSKYGSNMTCKQMEM
jgi:hypothetical protein